MLEEGDLFEVARETTIQKQQIGKLRPESWKGWKNVPEEKTTMEETLREAWAWSTRERTTELVWAMGRQVMASWMEKLPITEETEKRIQNSNCVIKKLRCNFTETLEEGEVNKEPTFAGV